MMDMILKQCFAENLFKMLASHGKRRSSRTEIPMLNKLKYTDEAKLILENQ